ncbi:MBL fold metallo-hydrolase [Clostridium sp. MCC353]|uniref:MBL fold metallo-hydrolase n=1 Tax=Clostridium sp. MCC353 TaxID=2592646 RepID=UPI001C019074|nr:MBL fold metallo-hydrolase [Clostridium sp. MCC353]MBT9775028.1 MBL fold metallo-hydrolase [Clostridium sp. MCC353]
MYELIQAGAQTYYINCPAKAGIYVRENSEAYLIDSGGDKDAGKKILKILNANGWKLQGIINTHSNADHIGGNRYLQKQTGCNVFAADLEAPFIRHPVLEPSFLYGGFPCRDLRHKFLLAEESGALSLEDERFPKELEVIPLPGHFFQMIGIRTPDDIVFLADCLSSRETLEKYQVSFIYDVEKYLETLDMVGKMQAGLFVPAHAAADTDLGPLLKYNRDKILEIESMVLKFCETPSCFEDLLKRLFDEYRLTLNFEQYVLVGSTLRSYLSWMRDKGNVDVVFEDNRLLWKAG